MSFLLKYFCIKKADINDSNTNNLKNEYELRHEKQQKIINTLKDELNKTVYDFIIDMNIKIPKCNLEKFGIVSNIYKFGIFDNKKQFFKCLQINPYLKQIDINKNKISNKINLNEIKQEIKYINYKKIEVNIDFGNFMELYLDTDEKLHSQYILSEEEPSGLFGLFYLAYANHKNIFIRPDDLWFHIVLQLQIIINNFPEELRDCFVNHDGKKNIRILNKRYSKEFFIDYINEFNQEMKKDIKNDFIELTNTNFSSTSISENVNSIIFVFRNILT
jgi:hypothetical protein